MASAGDRRSIGVLVAAWTAVTGLVVVQGFLSRWFEHGLTALQASGGDPSGFILRFSAWWAFASLLDVALLGLLSVGSWRLGGRLGRAASGVALVAAACGLAPQLATLIAPAWATSQRALPIQRATWIALVGALVVLRGLLLALAVSATRRRTAVVVIAASTAVLTLAHAVLLLDLFDLGPRTTSVLRWSRTALAIAAEGGVLVALALAYRGLAPAVARAREDWLRVAAGVRLYASALGWRIALVGVTYAAILLAALNRSITGLAVVMWVAAPLELAAVLALAAGVYRIAAVPDRRAAVLAWLALGVIVVGVTTQVFALGQARELLRLVGEDSWMADRAHLDFARELLRVVEVASLVLGLGGAIALLAALRTIAARRGHTRLATRAGWLLGGTFAATIFAAIVRWMLTDPDARHRAIPTLVVAALAVIAALTVLLGVLAFVRDLARALDEQPIGNA